MAFVDLRDDNDVINRTIEENNNVKCNLVALNARGKERIKYFMTRILSKYNADDYAEDLFLSVMELCFNAVKANYAYVYVLDKIRRLLKYKADMIDLDSIWNSRYMMNMYTVFIDHAETKEEVKKIIRGEAEIFKIQANAEKEGREPNKEELARIETLSDMMDRTIRDKVKATLSISKAANKLIVDVINDAPITPEALKRVEAKRRIFLEYYKDDRIGEFYMENLDETESAGFGAAMIDSRLLAWDLEPTNHFKVLSLNKKTCATLTVPLEQVQ